MKRKITCLCDSTIEIDVPENHDASERPGLVDEILAGDFMTWKCPECGKNLKLEFLTRVMDAARNIDVVMVPELDRNAWVTGALKTPAAARVAIGYPELMEKCAIALAGLDDRAIEIIKLHLLKKAGKGVEPEFYFRGVEDDKLVFHVHGLRKDEVGVSKVPIASCRKIEETIETSIKENSYESFLTPPYVSIKNIVIDEESGETP